MNVLITGGAGFIGSHVADWLLAMNDTVHVLDNFYPNYSPAQKRKNVEAHLTKLAYHLHEGDIRDVTTLQRLFGQCHFDLVIHLAALPGVQASLQQAEEYFEVNVTGTQNLLETMYEHRVSKLIFGSSSSVYGEACPLPQREDYQELIPISPYAHTKYQAEQLCKRYYQQGKVESTCLRFFTVYGPRQRPDMAISQFLNALLNQHPIRIYGQGSTRDYTHVSDIVQGICKAIPHIDGFSVYNIGSGSQITIQQLIDVLEETTGQRATVLQELNRVGDVGHTWADVTKARQQLVYQPTMCLSEGIQQMLDLLMDVQIN